MERNSDQLAKLDMTIIRDALEDPRVVRLMTIPGIGPVVASTVLASIGDVAVRDPREVEFLLRTDAEGSPIRRSPCAPRTQRPLWLSHREFARAPLGLLQSRRAANSRL